MTAVRSRRYIDSGALVALLLSSLALETALGAIYLGISQMNVVSDSLPEYLGDLALFWLLFGVLRFFVELAPRTLLPLITEFFSIKPSALVAAMVITASSLISVWVVTRGFFVVGASGNGPNIALRFVVGGTVPICVLAFLCRERVDRYLYRKGEIVVKVSGN